MPMTRYSSRDTVQEGLAVSLSFSSPYFLARQGRRLLYLFLCAVLLDDNERIGWMMPKLQRVQALQSFFSNVTLRANNGDLSAVVYLPRDLKPGERTYYMSTRFDWSSMIGSIERTTTNPITEKRETHVLYGRRQWRLPHDPYWTESGIGLASEFGVGTDGAHCNFMCGWNKQNEVTNGILGYREAKTGESFLKIGVGELIKGSCSTCDSAEDYKYDSPYRFARPPVWTLEYGTDDDSLEHSNSIKLSHKAVLPGGKRGYKLEKLITLNNDQLLVKNTLTNLGNEAFSTAWYSHHLFTCDSHPVQYGYSVDFDLADDYSEPSTWTWSTPLEAYATVNSIATDDDDDDVAETKSDESVRIEMRRGIESNVKIKAEFSKDDQSKGAFTLRACNTKIRETIPELADESPGISMYAYNLYIESGTFSPQPQILLSLQPGESTSWTQQLDFGDDYPKTSDSPGNAMVGSLLLQKSVASTESASSSTGKHSKHRNHYYNRSRFYSNIPAITALVSVIAMALVVHHRSRRTKLQRRLDHKHRYLPIPDADPMLCGFEPWDVDSTQHANHDAI